MVEKRDANVESALARSREKRVEGRVGAPTLPDPTPDSSSFHDLEPRRELHFTCLHPFSTSQDHSKRQSLDMHLNGYEVWITCDGEPLPEYQAQVEGDGKTVACFIPSESGKASSRSIYSYINFGTPSGSMEDPSLPTQHILPYPSMSANSSRAMQEFVINWHDHVKTTRLSYTFKLDGRSLSHGSGSSAGGTGKLAGVLTGANIEQSFQFADLQTSGASRRGCTRI